MENMLSLGSIIMINDETQIDYLELRFTIMNNNK